MGQLEAAAIRGDCAGEAGDDAGGQALGVEIERARALAEKGQIELIHAVGDADREDVASPRVHRPHPRVRHSGYYGGRFALADVGQRHELAAMRQSERGVAQKVAHGAEFEFRQSRGRPLSQCAFEGAFESAPAVRGDRLTNHGTSLSRSHRFPCRRPRRRPRQPEGRTNRRAEESDDGAVERGRSRQRPRDRRRRPQPAVSTVPDYRRVSEATATRAWTRNATAATIDGLPSPGTRPPIDV